MGLFKKKENASEGSCSCGGAASAGAASPSRADARVKVYGTGCKRCHALYENAVAAVGEAEVEYVTDPARVAASGIMSLPALVIDGRVASAGSVPSAQEIAGLAGGAGDSCGCRCQ